MPRAPTPPLIELAAFGHFLAVFAHFLAALMQKLTVFEHLLAPLRSPCSETQTCFRPAGGGSLSHAENNGAQVLLVKRLVRDTACHIQKPLPGKVLRRYFGPIRSKFAPESRQNAATFDTFLAFKR